MAELSPLVGHCPVPKCEHKHFEGKDYPTVLALIKAHILANLQDPNHSDIADMEGWLEIPDGLGD